MIHNWIFFRHGKHWAQPFLKHGYGHIFIIARDDYNWMIIEPCFEQLRVRILNYGIKINIPLMIATSSNISKCIYVKLSNDPKKVKKRLLRLNIFNPVNCVSVIKYYLGIDKWSIITPYQLVRYLLQKRYLSTIIEEVKETTFTSTEKS